MFLPIDKTKCKLKCHEVYTSPSQPGGCAPARCYCVKSINIRSQQDIGFHFQILKHAVYPAVPWSFVWILG